MGITASLAERVQRSFNAPPHARARSAAPPHRCSIRPVIDARDLSEQRYEFSGRGNEISVVADLTRHGILAVLGCGQIVAMNPAANRIVSSGDGLRIGPDGLHASVASADSELRRRIAYAAEDGHPRPSSTRDFMRCDRPSNKRPLILEFWPGNKSPGLCSAHAVVKIIDPDRDVRPPSALVRALFGLTAAETDVAMRLLDGDGLQAIADDLVLSVATVKTHVQHIFQKTNTNRQAQLVRLLFTLVL